MHSLLQTPLSGDWLLRGFSHVALAGRPPPSGVAGWGTGDPGMAIYAGQTAGKGSSLTEEAAASLAEAAWPGTGMGSGRSAASPQSPGEELCGVLKAPPRGRQCGCPAE